jgi:hypothetical protein
MHVSVVTFTSVFVYVNTLNPQFMSVLSGGFTVSGYDWVNGSPQIQSLL